MQKTTQRMRRKKVLIFSFILVEFVLCSFLIASISMKMILPAILSAFLAVFITPFPDIVLEKMGKEPMNRNIRFAVGAIGFVLLCYVVPDGKIAEVRQRRGCCSSQAESCDAVDRVGEQYGDRNRICL